MTRKKNMLIRKLLLGSRIIKNKWDMPADISKRGHFLKRFWSSWSQFKFNGQFFDFSWSFRYWTTQTSHRIWNLTPFGPGRWVSHVLSHPIFTAAEWINYTHLDIMSVYKRLLGTTFFLLLVRFSFKINWPPAFCGLLPLFWYWLGPILDQLGQVRRFSFLSEKLL